MVFGDGLSYRVLVHSVFLLHELKVAVHYCRDVEVVPVLSVAVPCDVFQSYLCLLEFAGHSPPLDAALRCIFPESGASHCGHCVGAQISELRGSPDVAEAHQVFCVAPVCPS